MVATFHGWQWYWQWAVCLIAVGVAGHAMAGDTPANFKVAFIGDQGDQGDEAVEVLQLIAAEGTDMVVHAGDFDYHDDPDNWDEMISDVLGPCFPYFAAVGNHDDDDFYGSGNYQSKLIARMNCLGLPWDGDLGVQSTHTFGGILVILTAPGVFGDGDGYHDLYIRDQLEATDAIWRISCWHKNQNAMQVGSKGNEAGWGVYEESRLGGAIIATGHEHSYSRTNLLSDMSEQTIASMGNELTIEPGKTFAFVSGIGGRDIRDQDRCFPTTYPYGCDGTWASIYTSDQDANYGALFAEFNSDGDPCLAHFYFKTIDGNVIDEFWVRSTLGDCGDCPADATGDGVVDETEVEMIFEQWGCEGACSGDVNGDLVVDNRDYLMVLGHWGDCLGGGTEVSAPAPPRDPFATADRMLTGHAEPRGARVPTGRQMPASAGTPRKRGPRDFLSRLRQPHTGNRSGPGATRHLRGPRLGTNGKTGRAAPGRVGPARRPSPSVTPGARSGNSRAAGGSSSG